MRKKMKYKFYDFGFSIKIHCFQKCQNDEILNKASDNSNNPECIISNIPEVAQSRSSPTIIESTPEKLEDDSKSSSVDCIDTIDNEDKQEFQEVKFLPVNQFRLRNDEERTMCIKQQKNSWLQLNDSKKDFQSAIEKSSVAGPLSTLKRDREEHNNEKKVKRKIYDYFSPKN